MYRDACNYKISSDYSFIISGELSFKKIRKYLVGGDCIIPDQLNSELIKINCEIYIQNINNEDARIDHCLHEIFLEPTEDKEDISKENFVQILKNIIWDPDEYFPPAALNRELEELREYKRKAKELKRERGR